MYVINKFDLIMNLTIALINKIFDKYNTNVFENVYGVKLPTPHFEISSRAIHWLGQFTCNRRDFDGHSYIIKISSNYSFTTKTLANVVVHEMIHEYIQYKHLSDSNAHGWRFCSIMNNINDKFSELNIDVRTSCSIVPKTNVKQMNIVLFTAHGRKSICRTDKQFIISEIYRYFHNEGPIYIAKSTDQNVACYSKACSRVHWYYRDWDTIKFTNKHEYVNKIAA